MAMLFYQKILVDMKLVRRAAPKVWDAFKDGIRLGQIRWQGSVYVFVPARAVPLDGDVMSEIAGFLWERSGERQVYLAKKDEAR